jgi:hypothetical protein
MRTQYYESVVPNPDALYEYLRDNIAWEEGIKSKHGFTRLAKSISLSEYPELTAVIADVLGEKCAEYIIHGVYLNYYANGDMHTPNHSHPQTHQLVISLGGTRTLTVGKKSFRMKSGDAILFGSSTHGVSKEEGASGRISIATFMSKIEKKE